MSSKYLQISHGKEFYPSAVTVCPRTEMNNSACNEPASSSYEVGHLTHKGACRLRLKILRKCHEVARLKRDLEHQKRLNSSLLMQLEKLSQLLASATAKPLIIEESTVGRELQRQQWLHLQAEVS